MRQLLALIFFVLFGFSVVHAWGVGCGASVGYKLGMFAAMWAYATLAYLFAKVPKKLADK